MSNLENNGHNNIVPKQSLWLFCSKILPVITFFWIVVLYSKGLNYESYGSFQVAWMHINILNIIVGFGTPGLILSTDLRFFKTFFLKHKRGILAASLTLSVTVFSLFVLLSKPLPSSTRFIIIVFTVVQTISIIKEMILIKAGRYRFVFITNLLYSILFLWWHYYMLGPDFILNKLFTGVIAITLLKILILYSRIEKYDTIAESPGTKDFASHWLFLGLNEVLGVSSRWIDKLFLAYLLTSSEFAIFFNGSIEIPFFGFLVSIIGMVTILEFSTRLDNKEKIGHIFSDYSLLVSGFVFPVFFFLLVFNKDLFSSVLSDKYNASVPIFVISLFILPVRINNYTTILQCYERGNKIIIGSVLDICIAFLSMLLLYPVMGTQGVALSVVIATYVQAFYYLHQSAAILQTSIWNLLPIRKLLIKIFIIGSLYTSLHFILLKNSHLFRIGIGTAVTMLLVLVSLYFSLRKKHSFTNSILKRDSNIFI